MTDCSLSDEADVLGFVRYAPWSGDSSWLLSFKDKKEMFGDAHRPQVGGKTDGSDADEHDVAMDAAGEAEFDTPASESLPGLRTREGMPSWPGLMRTLSPRLCIR